MKAPLDIFDAYEAGFCPHKRLFGDVGERCPHGSLARSVGHDDDGDGLPLAGCPAILNHLLDGHAVAPQGTGYGGKDTRLV